MMKTKILIFTSIFFICSAGISLLLAADRVVVILPRT